MKDFIPYKEALALKELGFEEECLYCYFPNHSYKMGEKFDLLPTSTILPNQIRSIGFYIKDGTFSNTVLAPTYSQAFRFFREKYGLRHNIFEMEDRDKISGSIKGTRKNNFKHYGFIDFCDTDEEAELECLRKLISVVSSF